MLYLKKDRNVGHNSSLLQKSEGTGTVIDFYIFRNLMRQRTFFLNLVIGSTETHFCLRTPPSGVELEHTVIVKLFC